jgi:hypothetical protein
MNALSKAMAYAKRRNPDATAEELQEIAADVLHEWNVEDALEREERGVEDTPCLESCDTGSGEGRWHGVIGR